MEIDDKTIASKVKIELRVNGFRGEDLAVQAEGGRVQLEGTVDSEDQIQKADQICVTVDGVLDVDNHLTVQ